MNEVCLYKFGAETDETFIEISFGIFLIHELDCVVVYTEHALPNLNRIIKPDVVFFSISNRAGINKVSIR